MKAKIAWLVSLALMALSSTVDAQDFGNAKAGQVYAERVCAECHAVGPERAGSPHTRAPSFVDVANTRGMTSMALRVWLLSPHPSMPQLILAEDDADNVIAYILTLKKR